MPITSSAKKAVKVSKRKRLFNVRRQEDMRSVIKQVEKLVKDKKVAEAEKFLPTAYKAIDKAYKRGVIKLNNASRKKSRIVRLIKSAKK